MGQAPVAIDTRIFGALGYALVEGVLDRATCDALCEAVATAAAPNDRRGLYGVRHLLRDVGEVRELAEAAEVRRLVEPMFGPDAFAVRGLYFDKTPEANWHVGWHQDQTIAVEQRMDVAGFGPWSVRDGVTHVRPPAEVLGAMVIVRLHLDPCGEDNGPLRVLPGSHRRGYLDAGAIREMRKSVDPVACCVGSGGAVVMTPLTVHASSPAVVPSHRRVVHLEYAAEQLPGGLRWRVS